MPQLVLASGSAGKLRELRALLTPIDVIAQGELGIESPPEPHHTFVENALVKARHAARLSGHPALSDDSGLCCAGLAGEPGVHSARFAGESATDAQNNALLLQRLQGVADRRAHYVCALVAVLNADDPEPLIAMGRWSGRIVDQARGSAGFGYDPYFFLEEPQCTAAEMDAAAKNAISHRGRALQELRQQLHSVWGW